MARRCVTLALWFHDVVCDPRGSDNERQSADFARAELGALEVPADACQRIAEHILATAKHSAHGDGALVVDIDLAILGSREHDFARFEKQIRSEYAFVGEPAPAAATCCVALRHARASMRLQRSGRCSSTGHERTWSAGFVS